MPVRCADGFVLTALPHLTSKCVRFSVMLAMRVFELRFLCCQA